MADHGFPAQAIVFMGIIFILLLLLVLFFLFLNKAMCFASCGGIPCLESEKPASKKEKASLGETYAYDDESSSGSEDELIMRYQASLHPALLRQPSIMRKPPKSIANGGSKYGAIEAKEPIGPKLLLTVDPPEAMGSNYGTNAEPRKSQELSAAISIMSHIQGSGPTQGQLRRRPKTRPELPVRQFTENPVPRRTGTSNLQNHGYPQQSRLNPDNNNRKVTRRGNLTSDAETGAVSKGRPKTEVYPNQDRFKMERRTGDSSEVEKPPATSEEEHPSRFQRLIQGEIYRRDSQRASADKSEEHRPPRSVEGRYVKGKQSQHPRRPSSSALGADIVRYQKDRNVLNGRNNMRMAQIVSSGVPDLKHVNPNKKGRKLSKSGPDINSQNGPPSGARGLAHHQRNQESSASRESLANKSGGVRAVSDSTLVTKAVIHHSAESVYHSKRKDVQNSRRQSLDGSDPEYENFSPRRHSAGHAEMLRRFKDYFGRRSKSTPSSPSLSDFDHSYENVNPPGGYPRRNGYSREAGINSVGLPDPPKPPRRFQPLNNRDRRGASPIQQRAESRKGRSQGIGRGSVSKSDLSGDELRRTIKQELIMFNNGLRHKVKSSGFGPFRFKSGKSRSSKANAAPRFDFIQKEEFEKLPNRFRVFDSKRYRVGQSDDARNSWQTSTRDHSDGGPQGLSEEEELFLMSLTGREKQDRNKVLDGPLHMELPGRERKEEPNFVSTNLMNISKLAADQPVIPKRTPPKVAPRRMPPPRELPSTQQPLHQKGPTDSAQESSFRKVPPQSNLAANKSGDRKSIATQTLKDKKQGINYRGKFLGSEGRLFLSPEEQVQAALDQIQDMRQSYETSNMNCKFTQTDGAWNRKDGERAATGGPHVFQRVIEGNLYTVSVQEPEHELNNHPKKEADYARSSGNKDNAILQAASSARSDDASAADSDQAGTLEGIEGEVLDDSQLPTGESVAFSGDGDLESPGDYGDSGAGEVEVAFLYSGENRRMNITIIRCLNLLPKDKGGAGSYRLRLVLFPSKRQRAKTRIRDGDRPEFKELFRFSRIYPHELVGTSVRIRLYGAERLRKERLIGEGVVKFSALNVSKKQVIRLRLKPQSELGDDDTPYSSMSDLSGTESGSSLQSIQHGGGLPELLAGLSYNATTGRLAVEVIKGSHFKQLAAGRAPDSYVKVAVMSSSGFEMSKSKSSVRRGQPNPTFKETFIFQIAQFQLNEVTLMFTVFNKKGMKRKNAIGWFSMGLSNTSEEELAHWNEMQTSNGQQVCRWHALLESKS